MTGEHGDAEASAGVRSTGPLLAAVRDAALERCLVDPTDGRAALRLAAAVERARPPSGADGVATDRAGTGSGSEADARPDDPAAAPSLLGPAMVSLAALLDQRASNADDPGAAPPGRDTPAAPSAPTARPNDRERQLRLEGAVLIHDRLGVPLPEAAALAAVPVASLETVLAEQADR